MSLLAGMMCKVPGDKRCPVKSFLKNTSKLNPEWSAFWQRTKEIAPEKPQDLWYCNSPAGILITLNKKVKEI